MFDLLDLDTALLFFAAVPAEWLNKIGALRLSGFIAPELDGRDRFLSLHVLSGDHFLPGWRSLCRSLRRMESLKKLTLCIHEDYLDLDWDRVLLKSLIQIKVPKPNYVIEVIVRGSEMGYHFNFEGWDEDQVPFTVRKAAMRDDLNIDMNESIGYTIPRNRRLLWKRLPLVPFFIVFICGRLAIEGCKGIKRRRGW